MYVQSTVRLLIFTESNAGALAWISGEVPKDPTKAVTHISWIMQALRSQGTWLVVSTS